jgi:hypothetical protein
METAWPASPADASFRRLGDRGCLIEALANAFQKILMGQQANREPIRQRSSTAAHLMLPHRTPERS